MRTADAFAVFALTDVDAVSTVLDGAGQCIVRKTITAFQRAADGYVQEGLFELAARIPAERAYLYEHALSIDSIVHVWVTRERGTLWMQTLPEPAHESHLAELRAAQTAETGFDDPVLGWFLFDRMSCVHRCTVDWLGRPVSLETEAHSQDDAALALLRAVCAQAAAWEARIQTALRRETGMAGTLDTIMAGPEGELTFWMVVGDRVAQLIATSADGITEVLLLG